MALNIGKLKEIQTDLTTRASGGDGLYFYAKDIGKETDVRILPPLPELDGVFFFEMIVWWIKGKSYVSPATFGQPDPIQEEIDAAKELKKDKQLQRLLEDKDNLKRSSEFLMPILLLKPVFGAGGKTIERFDVVDNKAKVLSCGIMLCKAINKVVTGRKYQNDTEDGVTDRVEGTNLILAKEGKGFDTEYFADGGDQIEMEKKYYKDYPNVYKLAEERLLPEDVLVGVIRNYLYGEDMPDTKKAGSSKTKTRKDEEDDEPPVRRGRKVEVEEDDEPPVRKPAKKVVEVEDDEPPVRKPARKVEVEEDDEPPVRKPAKRVVEVEEDDEPPVRRGPAKPAKKEYEDDLPPFEEDDEPPVRKAVKAPAKPAGKKGVLDSLNDLDD